MPISGLASADLGVHQLDLDGLIHKERHPGLNVSPHDQDSN